MSDDGSGDETDSEADYENAPHIHVLSPFTPAQAKEAWTQQRGLCRVSKMPMTSKSGLYAPVATHRVFGDASAPPIIVCKAVHEMRDATGLAGRSFANSSSCSRQGAPPSTGRRDAGVFVFAPRIYTTS